MISLKRLLGGAPAPRPSGERRPAAPPTTAGYAIGGFHFLTTEPLPGYFFVYHQDAYFDVPEGHALLLETALIPSEGGRSLQRAVVTCVASGDLADLVFEAIDDAGAVHEARAPLRHGASAVNTPIPNPAGARLRLELRGRGRFKLTALRPRFIEPPAAPTPQDAAPNPLLDLVREDYEAARKAGAEIPRPPLERVF